MDALDLWVQKVYNRRIKKEYDAVVPVVGDEGDGKSTLMLRIVESWQKNRGRWPTVDDILETIVWDDRQEFKQAMSQRDARSAITTMDAARVLYKRDVMQGDQKEVEKDLLDVRTKEFLFLLGFQEWDIIPSMLQKRRAKFLLYIPERGVVWGYNRDTLDKRVDSDEWPEPDMKDTFLALDGTKLWSEFQAIDKQKKDSRIEGDQSADPDDARREEATKTVLRATKPWSDDGGMTYREAAKLVDYSRGWVSDRVQEWKDGEHQGLLDKSEMKTAVQQ